MTRKNAPGLPPPDPRPQRERPSLVSLVCAPAALTWVPGCRVPLAPARNCPGRRRSSSPVLAHTPVPGGWSGEEGEEECVRDPCCGQPGAQRPPEPALPARADGSPPEPGRPRRGRGPVAAAAGRPTGAVGQLPPPRPRTRNPLLLLLKNPSEHVYIEPHKLPARAFTIHGKS